jgi:signal transduction histidine kinase
VRTRAAQVQLIGEFAPLVQQSLELADVLPSVAVQLSDHFDLAGVSMSTGGGGTGQVELFSFGVRPARGAPVALRPPEHLAQGETLALALQRGGRSAAVLQLVAGRDLDHTELQSLRALTELVTAAVVNASLYASQQQALRRLRDLDALKTVFLGTASHELRTPVTAIGGFASLLTSSWDRFEEEQRRDFVERIGANARSLSAVVQDLLDFSVLDKGTLAVTVEEIDLAPLVESVVNRLSGVFSTHEIAFSAVPAPTIAGNANGLERIVTNLLTNAVKFSPAGTSVSIAVGPAEDGYGAELVVSDQGPGIPVEERQRVFSRFFRGTGDAVLQTRGVGIGLSVVAEFVARLRGDIIVDDAPGGGARFTVRFPTSSDQLLAKEAVRAPTT